MFHFPQAEIAVIYGQPHVRDRRLQFMSRSRKVLLDSDRTANEEFARLMDDFVRERCERYGLNPWPYLKNR